MQHAQWVFSFAGDEQPVSIPPRPELAHHPLSGFNPDLPIAWISIPFVRDVDYDVGPMV